MARRGGCLATSSRAGAATERSADVVLARAESHPGAQEFLRIDRFAVDPGFVVQMRAGRPAGRAHGADHLSNADLVADPNVDLRHMAVSGSKSVAMVDLD